MPKKILLADDSITIQKVVELTFSDGDYEVTAVNNGAKAVLKLAEMRPDIILSDIIMPEKNGYEVCEYVKSHPEFRTIPVILLTGTFEPFDPDRADKAGCDAVVTKPFESQSLIHKVEELIEAARANAPTAPSPAMSQPAPSAPAPSPWSEEAAKPSASSFTAAPGFNPAPAPPAPPAPFAHDNDIFGAPPPADAFSGEKRGFPKMNFEEMQKESSAPPAPAQSAPPPPPAPAWDDQPAAFSGETRAFPKMNFDNMPHDAPHDEPPAAEPASSDADSPFGASPSAESFSGETRAFPKLNFEDLSKASSAPEPPPPPPPSAHQHETAPSLWNDQPAYGGETRGFPKMGFDEIQEPAGAASQAPPPASTPSPWDEPATPSAPAWSSPPEPSTPEPAEETPFGGGLSSPQAAPVDKPAWASPSLPSAASASESASSSAEPLSGNGLNLTDEQVDRIARRVVEIMSEQVVRNIAWEVIPDLAEMVVKERIRQLESEA
jgi:CheY-like chemotaxis protein